MDGGREDHVENLVLKKYWGFPVDSDMYKMLYGWAFNPPDPNLGRAKKIRFFSQVAFSYWFLFSPFDWMVDD